MARHFHEELKALKQKLIKMSRLSLYMIENALEGLHKRNPEFTKQVFGKEKMVNDLEMEIDEDGHNLLALAQPVAADLRLVTTILKINTDLERIGDHAINIAERVLILIEEPAWQLSIPLPEMANQVIAILQEAIDSFVLEDTVLAERVLKQDDAVDNFHDSIYSSLESEMEKDPSFVKTGMILARIGHDLERIGDLANNIAEDVIYMKQGKEVRHRISGSL